MKLQITATIEVQTVEEAIAKFAIVKAKTDQIPNLKITSFVSERIPLNEES